MTTDTPVAHGIALPGTLATVPGEVQRCLMEEKAALAALRQELREKAAQARAAQERIRWLEGVAASLLSREAGAKRAKRRREAAPAVKKEAGHGGGAKTAANAKAAAGAKTKAANGKKPGGK